MNAIMKGHTQMRDVKVKKLELLSKVKQNREKHIAEYKEAVEGYKEAALDEIQKGVDKLKSQVESLNDGEMIRLAAVSFHLPVPENHEQDYDQVITMLEMSVDDELTIKSDEFACYVMDNWDWQTKFAEVSKLYNDRKFRNN